MTVTAMAPESPARRQDSRRILVLWAIVSAFFLISALLAYPRISDFAILLSTRNYLGYAEHLIETRQYLNAAHLLEAMIEYRKPTSSEPSALLAEAYDRAGKVKEAAYWKARTEFLKAWWITPIPQTQEQLDKVWGETIRWGREASESLSRDPRFMRPDYLRPLLASLLERWTTSGARTHNWSWRLPPRDALAILLASGDFQGISDGRIGTTGSRTSVPIHVESIGGRFRRNTRIVIGDEPVVDVDQYQRGFHLVVLGARDGNVLEKWHFNTVENPESAEEMYRRVKDLPEGCIVVLAVTTTIGTNVNRWAIQDTLKLIGITLPSYRFITTELKPSLPYSAVGVRGATPGTGIAVYGEVDRCRAFLSIFPEMK